MGRNKNDVFHVLIPDDIPQPWLLKNIQWCSDIVNLTWHIDGVATISKWRLMPSSKCSTISTSCPKIWPNWSISAMTPVIHDIFNNCCQCLHRSINMKLVAHTIYFQNFSFWPPVNPPFFDKSRFKNVSLTRRPHEPFVQNLVALRPTVCPLGINSG